MLRGASHRLAALLLAAIPLVACSGNSTPTTPTSPQPPAPSRAAIDITSISVVGERATGGGYRYRVVVHLQESAGVAARVDAVDLTFMKGADVVMASRHDQPLAGDGGTVAGHGTADTRELVTTDPNTTHAYASSVVARITFTDASGIQAAATASADVPPLADPGPTTYTLSGVITDQANGAGIAGARVEALNGLNTGKAATTDPSGAYSLTGLAADGFRMRASASGYDAGEQNVTVPAIARADMALRRSAPPAACTYTVTPTSILGFPFTGGQATVTITRTSGTCGWQARSNASWLTLGSSAGSGSATLVAAASPNSLNTRTGVITVEWTGGEAQVTVVQGTPPDFCQVVLTVSGQSTIPVPASGGTYTAGVGLALGVPAFFCGIWSVTGTSSSPEISVGTVSSPSVTFTVAPKSTPGARTLFVEATVSFSGTTSGTTVGRLTVNQSGTP